MPKQIFISYQREDEEFARRLREFLIEHGFDTWMDVFDIPKGIDPADDTGGWDDEIDKGLRSSDIVIGIMSPEAVKSHNVLNEWGWALSNNLPFILLRLREIAQREVPHRFGRINYIDLTSAEEIGLRVLEKALQNPHKHIYKETLDERNRRIMLDKVYGFWVKDILEKSLHGMAMIELGMEEDPGLVEHPWDMILETEKKSRPIPPGKKIFDIFSEMNGAMLILGEPGSGKTVIMLELARNAIEQAKADYSLPIPVVFNLSSWAQRQVALDKWLVEELNKKYQIPKEQARQWVDEDALMLLLDGLDEVKQDAQDDCVKTINEYRNEHGLVPISVCSRFQEYQQSVTRLKMYGAIKLLPLSDIQVFDHLNKGGKNLEALIQIIQTNCEILEWAKSPLMLIIMSVAYKEASSRELLDFRNSRETRLSKIVFDRYIQKMFNRIGRYKKTRFSKAETVHWICWLAKQMRNKNQTIFYLEDLQPTWLASEKQQRNFQNFVGLGVGLIIGLSIGYICSLFFGPHVGLSIGIFLAIIWGGGVANAKDPTMESVEIITFSWKDSVPGLGGGFILGFGFFIIGSIVFGLIFGWPDGLIGGILMGLITWMSGWMICGVVDKQDIQHRVKPNQGINQSLQNGLKIFFVSGLLTGLLSGFLFWLGRNLFGGGEEVAYGIGGGLVIGLATGLIGWFSKGGLSFVNHYILRFIFLKNGLIPRNIVDFLDYSAKIILLQRMGGGFMFIHRLLLEHFAEMDVDEFLAKYG